MANDTFKKYEQMLGDDMFDSTPVAWDDGVDDAEDFLTSKEIVKMHQNGDIDDKAMADIVKGPVEIEEDVHFKRYTKRREHKYTEKELDEIRDGCKRTLVHDYSEFDRYHISDEERAKNDSLAELSLKLGGLKRLYRKVDQYIYAMRIVVEAWEILEKKENFIHDPKEFYQMVSDGRIYHSGILMPKLKGMDRYNMDLLIQYISNPELDPQDLLTKEELKKRDAFYDDWYDDEDDDESEEEEMTRLLSPEEVQFILDYEDNPPMIKVHDIKPKYIKGYDKKTFGKSKKKFSKKERGYVDSLHEILKKIQSNPANRNDMSYTRSWMVTNSMFEPEKKEKDFWDDLYFDGSWTSKDDLFLYDMAVREETLKQHPPGESYLTYADRELQQFFSIMESNGVNVIELRRRMNMSDDKLKSSEVKQSRKDNKRIEAALIQRITKLNGNPKFKKIVAKAEKAINNEMEKY